MKNEPAFLINRDSDALRLSCDSYIGLPSKQIIGANWCVKCLPDKNYAEVVFGGNSLCLNCFEEKTK